jgi:hypothetical protein
MEKAGVLFLVVSALSFFYGLALYFFQLDCCYGDYDIGTIFWWWVAKWTGILGVLMLTVNYIMSKK